MLALVPFPYRLLAILALAAGLLGFGWVKGATHENGVWEARVAKERAQAEEADHHHADAISRIDQTASAHMKEKDDEIAGLRVAVATGAVRLRVAAHCPVQPAAAGAGVDHGPGPELDAGAGQHYLAIRAGIERVTAQLTACQAILADERK